MAMNVSYRGRQILIHGLAFIMAGLVWGFVVPQTPHPRLALGAHIQLVMNGLLFIAIAVLLLKLPNRVGARSAWVMLLAGWLTWPMALSEVANSWWGTSQTLALAAGQAGAKGGAAWHEGIVKVTHIVAGLGLAVAWALLLVGFLGKPASKLE